MNLIHHNSNFINNIRTGVFFLSIILAVSCNNESKSKGYENLDSLYSDFVRYLKLGGDDLKQYCYRICPDEGTIAYMEENKVSYAGIPDELRKQNLPISAVGEEYHKNINQFRERLAQNQQLDDLIYIGRIHPEEHLFDEKLQIYVSETSILIKSGNDTMRCQLGEMFNYDKKWKAFTKPKLDW